MNTVDFAVFLFAVFLVAGILGVIPVDGRLAWGLVAIWALLKLLKVI